MSFSVFAYDVTPGIAGDAGADVEASSSGSGEVGPDAVVEVTGLALSVASSCVDLADEAVCVAHSSSFGTTVWLKSQLLCLRYFSGRVVVRFNRLAQPGQLR